MTIDDLIADRQPELELRRSRFAFRRRRAYAACVRLVVLREHQLYGWHDVGHIGACVSRTCQLLAPPKPIKPARPTYASGGRGRRS